MRRTVRALAAEYAEKGSVLARSDAGCATLFCKERPCRRQGAGVKVNTTPDGEQKAHAMVVALEANAEQLLAEFVPQADRVYRAIK